MEYYVKKTLVITLINNEDLKKIKKEYKKFMLDNRYPMLENSYDSDTVSNYEKKIPSFVDITSSSESEKNDFSSDISAEDKNDSSDSKDKDEELKKTKNLKKNKKEKQKKSQDKKNKQKKENENTDNILYNSDIMTESKIFESNELKPNSNYIKNENKDYLEDRIKLNLLLRKGNIEKNYLI